MLKLNLRGLAVTTALYCLAGGALAAAPTVQVLDQNWTFRLSPEERRQLPCECALFRPFRDGGSNPSQPSFGRAGGRFLPRDSFARYFLFGGG